jgi:hypothetical protein
MIMARILPLPAGGERVGVRGSDTLDGRRKRPPLTLALSPQRGGEREHGRQP